MDKVKVSFRNYKFKQNIAEYIILFFLSVIFLLLFSLWTSPYYKDWYGCDASFFSLVGRGILNGKVMYRDFYDLKGPYFFFIEALTQVVVKGRLGIFLLQIPPLYASVILIWKTALLFVNKAKAGFIVGIFYVCHIATLWGGNTLEEFFLPMSLLCLYLVCRLYKAPSIHEARDFAKNVIIPPAFATMLGLFLGIIILSKISVGSTIIGIIAGICFLHLSEKRWGSLFLFLIYVLLGILIAAIPIVIYFTYYGCLMDMLKCVFVIGFRRSKDFGELFNITWELKSTGAIFAFIFAATHMRRTRKSICTILLAASAATYILLHLGTPFYYYFTSAYPCLILALALFLEVYNPLFIFESFKQALCLIVLSVFLIYYVPTSFETVRTAMYSSSDETFNKYKEDCEELASFIPPFERNSIFSYLIDMQFYEINDMMPCNKYVVNLPFFIAMEPEVLNELTDFMNNTPPKWIVCGENLDLNIPEIATILDSKYSCIYENSVGKLYILND